MKKSLDALLADPRVWRGRQAPQGMRTLSSGYRALDAILPGGGWPRAGLTEIVVERWGTGELQMIVPLLRQLSDDGHDEAAARHGWIAWIAPPYVPYAPALATAGIDVARLLLVHAAIDSEALWAAEQALVSASCQIVLAWARNAAHRQLRRLQLAAEDEGVPCILFRPPDALRAASPAALKLYLGAGANGWLDVIKSRGGRPASLPLRDLFLHDGH